MGDFDGQGGKEDSWQGEANFAEFFVGYWQENTQRYEHCYVEDDAADFYDRQAPRCIDGSAIGGYGI